MSDNVIVIPPKYNSIITTILAILVVGMVVVGYFGWRNMKEENLKLQTEIISSKQLTESLIRGSNQWATKDDLMAMLKDSLTKDELKSLKEDLKKMDSKLKSVGQTVGIIKNKVAKMEKSDNEGPSNDEVVVCESTGELIDTHEYTKNPQIKELTDVNNAPLATVEFDAASPTPWSYEIFNREYYLTTTVGEKDNGQLIFYHDLKYSIPDVNEDKYLINLTSSEYKQIKGRSKFFWWNPKIDLNVFGGLNVYKFNFGKGRVNNIVSAGADIGISTSSYGETEVNSSFRFIRLGVGYDGERRAGRISFAPVLFNIGKPLPLLTNLYLAPQIGIDTAGGLTLTLGFGPQF